MLGMMTPRPRALGNFEDESIWYGGGISYRAMTRAGVTVDEEVALTYAAVFCATRVLAEGLGGLPLPLYERTSRYDRNLATAPDVAGVADCMDGMPNPRMTGTVFREGRTAHQVNWGGGFAEIEFDPRTGKINLWPIHPSRVTPPRPGDHPDYAYLVKANVGPPMPLRADEMLHLPGALSDDGTWGRGVIQYGRELIGGGIGTERAGHQFLGSGGQPKGVLEMPGASIADRQKRAAFREEWREVHGKPESNEPTIALLGAGSKYTPISLTNEANQMIQSQEINAKGVARIYKVPGYKINAEDKETAGTIEQKAIEFVVHSLLPWARKWEDQLGMKLLTPAQRLKYYFEHNFTALLRGDQAARYIAYRIAFSIGIMTINEIRRLENMNNIGPAGDQHFVPANMTTAERALSGDMGNGGAMGSDHNGQPADNPRASLSADPDRDHADWLDGLTNTQRGDAKPLLQALRLELPERARIDHIDMARQALLDVLGRVLTKESNAAARAAKDTGRDFEGWLREFYSAHQVLLAGALRTACTALRIAGVTRWADRLDLAEWLTARSTTALKESFNRDTREVFARKLADWPTVRARELTEELLAGVKPALAIRVETPEPSSLDRAVEALTLAAARQLDTPPPAPVAPQPIFVQPEIHVHPAPKGNAVVERNAIGQITRITQEGSDGAKPKTK